MLLFPLLVLVVQNLKLDVDKRCACWTKDHVVLVHDKPSLPPKKNYGEFPEKEIEQSF